MSRLNVVVVVLDDTPPDAPQAMPYLTAGSAGNWVSFPNATVQRPLCAPARAAIFTGLTNKRHGIISNEHGELHANALTDDGDLLAPVMQRAGYLTGMFGKYGYPTPGDDITTDIPVGWNRWSAFTENNGQGKYDTFTLNEDGTPVAYTADDHSSDVLFSQAITWIQANANRKFFAYIAVNAPHATADPPARHAATYTLDDLPHPPSENEADVSDKPAWYSTVPLLTTPQLDALHAERLNAWRCLRAVDEGIEDLVTALSGAGILDDTVIIVVADNSNLCGEHRQSLKQHLYIECMTPHMYVRYPGATARESTALVSNIDIAPTLTALAGRRMPNNPDGMSIIPVLTQQVPDANFRTEVFVERPGLQDWHGRGIRQADQTYVLSNDGSEELYDLTTDPYQLANLAASDPTTCAEMQARLARLEADTAGAWPY